MFNPVLRFRCVAISIEDISRGASTFPDLSDAIGRNSSEAAFQTCTSLGASRADIYAADGRAARQLRRELNKFNQSPQLLRGSFSSVWTATIATKYSFSAFFEIYKVCILLHRSDFNVFSKKRFTSLHNFGDFESFFIQNFDFSLGEQFLFNFFVKVYRNFTNMLKNEIFGKTARC